MYGLLDKPISAQISFMLIFQVHNIFNYETRLSAQHLRTEERDVRSQFPVHFSSSIFSQHTQSSGEQLDHTTLG